MKDFWGKLKKNERGLMSVEVSLFLTLFLVFFICIMNYINLILAQTVIQHALNETAREISQVSYVITKLELQDNFRKAAKSGDTMVTNTKNTWDSIDKFSKCLSKIAGGDTSFGSVMDTVDSGKTAVDDTVDYVDYLSVNGKKDAIGTAKDLVAQGTLGLAANYFVKRHVRSHLGMLVPGGDADKMLKNMGVVNGVNGIHVPGGAGDGFFDMNIAQEFYQSGTKDMELCIAYEIRYDAIFFQTKPMKVVLRASTALW